MINSAVRNRARGHFNIDNKNKVLLQGATGSRGERGDKVSWSFISSFGFIKQDFIKITSGTGPADLSILMPIVIP